MDLYEVRDELIHAIEKAGIEVPWAQFGPEVAEFGVTLEDDSYEITVRRVQ
jgi:hypothetical protein